MAYSGRAVGRLRRLVWELYPHRCHWCDCALTFQTMTVEHLNPRSRGGSDSTLNLRPACGNCNFSRGNKPEPARKPENQLKFFI